MNVTLLAPALGAQIDGVDAACISASVWARTAAAARAVSVASLAGTHAAPPSGDAWCANDSDTRASHCAR